MKSFVKKVLSLFCLVILLVTAVGCDLSNFNIILENSKSGSNDKSGLTSAEIQRSVSGVSHSGLEKSTQSQSQSVSKSSALSSYELICLQSKNVLGVASLYQGGCLVKIKAKNDLDTIIVPETLDGYVVKGVEEEGFYEQKSLEHVVLPNTVEIIKYGAFDRCKKLTNINMPSSLKVVEGRAFSRTNVKELVFSEGLTSIGFAMCESCYNLKRVVLPNSLLTISDNAFSDCTNLSSVQISNELIALGECAFNGCAKLGKLDLPKTLTSIGSYAFSCNRINEEYELPADMDYIPSGLYGGCDLITEIKIKPNVKTIYSNAYSGTSITTLTIPSTVKKLEWFAFSNCAKLETVVVEEGITTLPQRLFEYSNNVKNVSLPSTITDVYLVFDVESFETINYNGSMEDLLKIKGIADYIGQSTVVNCIQ